MTDVTVDLETVGLLADSAIVKIAAVAWNRYLTNPLAEGQYSTFACSVDLRSCIVEGCRFYPDTVAWWSERTEGAKKLLCNGTPYPIRYVLEKLSEWLSAHPGACLWSQGTDVDVAILRYSYAKFGVKFPVHFHKFRDSRSIIVEAMSAQAGKQLEAEEAYAMYTIPAFVGEEHDALYDAFVSAYRTKIALDHMRKNEKV